MVGGGIGGQDLLGEAGREYFRSQRQINAQRYIHGTQ